MPKEEVVLERVFYWSIQTLVLPLNTLDHRVVHQCVALRITTTESASATGSRLLLTNINCLYLVDLALLVDNFDVIFVDLEDEACVLGPVVVDQVYRGLIIIIL